MSIEEIEPLSPDDVADMFLRRAELTAESGVKQRQNEVGEATYQLNRAEALLSDAWAQLEAIRLIKTRQPSTR